MQNDRSLPPPDGKGFRVLIQDLSEEPLDDIEEHLSFSDFDLATPDTLGPNEVLVAIRSAAVSWVDVIMTSGLYQHQPTLPYCPGLEYSGIVAAKGASVDASFIEGDAVFVDCFGAGARTSGRYQASGGFSTHAIAPVEAIRKMPAQWSFDQACNFSGHYETAYYCLFQRGQLQAGETILINGASGGTGLAAVHLAKLVGARVIATGRYLNKLDIVKAAGADHVIQTKSEDGKIHFRDQVKALTNGNGVDVVYDGVGGPIGLESLRSLRFGGRYLVVGWASTPMVARGKGQRGAPRANQLPTNLILMKRIDVLGAPMVIATQKQPEIREARRNQLERWIQEDRIHPYVSHHFELHEAIDALRAKQRGDIIGGCAIRPPHV